jgi:ketosteroid isomerase-like protein
VAGEAEQNIELLKEAFGRWNAGDRDFDLETIHPEIELHTPLSSTQGRPYRGRDGFLRWMVEIDEQFESWELHADDWLALDDGRILALGSILAKGRGSGVELNQELAWLFALQDGKLFRYEVFFDREEGRREAGLTT